MLASQRAWRWCECERKWLYKQVNTITVKREASETVTRKTIVIIHKVTKKSQSESKSKLTKVKRCSWFLYPHLLFSHSTVRLKLKKDFDPRRQFLEFPVFCKAVVNQQRSFFPNFSRRDHSFLVNFVSPSTTKDFSIWIFTVNSSLFLSTFLENFSKVLHQTLIKSSISQFTLRHLCKNLFR